MPIYDGVEAAKRIRALEIRRKANVLLPSKMITLCLLVSTSYFYSYRSERRLPRVY